MEYYYIFVFPTHYSAGRQQTYLHLTMEEIYWLTAIISSGLLGLMVLLNIFGFDVDGLDLDFLDVGDAFSFNSLVAMVCIGAWTGYMAHYMTPMKEWQVLATAIAAGAVAYVASIFVLRKMKGLESSGTIRLENAIGKTGTVYLSVPGNRSGKGQIQVVVQGRLMILDAMTEKDKIETGSKALVYDIENNVVMIELFNEETL